MIKLEDLTNGERLLLEQRREGITAAKAAKKRGVSLYRFNRWLRDAEEGPKAELGELRFHEGAFILRRRAGLSVGAFAKRLGVTPWWVSQMELGRVTDARLREHWKAPGKVRKPGKARARRRAR